MKKVRLFIDGSVNNIIRIGYGAYLAVNEKKTVNISDVKVKQFENTTSSKLELQCLLWALSEVPKEDQIIIYTDSQSIMSLLDRKDRLEQNRFRSKKNKLFTNHELYKQFYDMIALLNCEFVKIKGHSSSKEKGEIEQLFTLVDRAARKALRNQKVEK